MSDDKLMTDAELAAFMAQIPEIEERESKATKGPWHFWDGHDEAMPSDQDVNFTAHARTDVPLMLRAIRTLHAKLTKREDWHRFL